MPLLDSFTVDHTRMEAPAVRVAKTMNTPAWRRNHRVRSALLRAEQRSDARKRDPYSSTCLLVLCVTILTVMA